MWGSHRRAGAPDFAFGSRQVFFSPPPQECIGRRQAVNLDGLLDDGTDRNEHRGAGQDPGLCQAS